ncbi:hypothetical protein [Paenibacillus sp. YSY-4.3]
MSIGSDSLQQMPQLLGTVAGRQSSALEPETAIAAETYPVIEAVAV